MEPIFGAATSLMPGDQPRRNAVRTLRGRLSPALAPMARFISVHGQKFYALNPNGFKSGISNLGRNRLSAA